MIILEFLVFVVSSGLFCSEKFRHHVWAVIVAGAIATGSSLLFAYDLGVRLAGHEKEPPVITRIVRQTVVKTVAVSQPAAAVSAHSCLADYPVESLNKGEQGVTGLAFKILTDGTVDAIRVLTSSGSERLDEAAVKCASHWHYRPAIKNGQLAESNWKASVTWVLPSQNAPLEVAPPASKPEAGPKPVEEVEGTPKKEDHHWYDPFGWFSSSPSADQSDANAP
jgi:TonB family protein